MWNRFLVRWLAALIAVGAMTPLAHADADDADHRLLSVLDADNPTPQRQSAFAYFQQRANAGNTYSQYVVGSLYRAGEHLPHGFVKRDPDEAARYLSNAAAHGYLSAMAKMAELELERGHPLDAMLWAQLYGHYTGAQKQAKGARNKANDYIADLLHRIYDRFDEAKMTEVDNDLNTFVAVHDADVRAGIKANRQRYAGGIGKTKVLDLKFKAPPTDLARSRVDTLADYLVAFSADGSARQAWLLDAVPDMRVGVELKTIAMSMRVNADPAATETRYALLPVRLTYRSYSLRANP